MNDPLPNKADIEKIFIIDDTPYNLRLLSGILKRKPYEVYQAGDGETALIDIPNIMPDLILLDIKMKGLDGYEVCDRLKANSKTAEIPIIFISGLDEIVDKAKAFKLGGVDYITKPFQPAEVLLRVENQIKLRSLQQHVQEKNILLEETVEKLKQTQSQLVQHEKMASLGQLVAGIAHEINNPVTFISGNITHVRNYTSNLIELVKLYQVALPNPPEEIEDFEEDIDLEFLSDDLQNLLHSMTSGTERIQTIVQSLRNFSRLDEAKLKTVDIHEGLDSSLMMLQYRLHQKDCPNIQTIKHYGSLPKVECYAGEINQVFMNILANAIDALTLPHKLRKEKLHARKTMVSNSVNPDRRLSCLKKDCASVDPEYAENWSQANCQCHLPTIEISTELLNSQNVQITIADNGPGIPDRVQQRLFDPFFTTKPVGSGIGLGLSISYQTIVEGHHGEISCESIPGEGTTFTIVLPLQQSPDRSS